MPTLHESLITQIIDNHRRAIRWHVVLSAGIVALGVVIIVTALVWQPFLEAGLNPLLSIGGGFVASLSTFQLKEILSRKEKVGILATLKDRLGQAEESAGASPEDRARIEHMFWELIKKTATG